MTDPAPQFVPAAPAMAEKLAINRTGKLTSMQHRISLIVGVGALATFACPAIMMIQMLSLIMGGDAPVSTLGGIIFTLIGAVFLLFFAGLIGSNAYTFLPEVFMRQPVRYARGTLRIRVPETNRPELPFSYIVEDYSFAPYIVPDDVPMLANAPYIVYYAARSRVLLSIGALAAPDADQWEPQFDQEERPPLI